MTVSCESLSFSEAVSELSSMIADQSTEGLASLLNSISMDKIAYVKDGKIALYSIDDIRQWGKDVAIGYSWNASREHPAVEYKINEQISDGCFESQDDALFSAFESLVVNA